MIPAIIQYLLDRAEITALVGRRIYPSVRPQNDPLPALVLKTVSKERVSSLAGDSGSVNGGLQVDVMAARYDEKTDLVNKVRTALNDLSTAEIQAAWITNEIEIDEPPTAGKERGTYRTAMDWAVWHGETA